MLTLWGVMGGHSLLETARDALFLSSLPANYLPWAYIGIALSAIVFIQLQAFLPLGSGNRRVLSSLLVLSAAITVGFWALLGTHRPWISLVSQSAGSVSMCICQRSICST